MSVMVVSGNVADLLVPLPTPWSSTLWSLLFVFVGFVMAYWGGYRVIEPFCKVLIAAMVGCLVMVAIISQPDPVEIVRGAVVPIIPGDQGLYSSLLILMALIGTMAGSTTNLTYAYYMREKGWKDISHLSQQRFDLIFGVVCLFLLAALLQIAAAATVHPLGIELEDASDLVRIFSEVQGMVGLIVFSLGLWGAAFSTLVGTLVGYGFVVADLSRFVASDSPIGEDFRKNDRRHPVYRACVIFWSISPLYILFTGISPVWLVLIVNSMFVFLIPVLTPVLLKLTNDKDLMGSYKNGLATNAILVCLLLVALYITAANVKDAVSSFF